jgi:SNF2 family DNA or RNA helicase
MQEAIKLIVTTKKGTALKVPVTIEREDDRIFFLNSPFALKDEIKAMQGARWHGYIPDDNRKIWSVADSVRNNFQLDFMQGGNPYAWWDKPLREWGYSRPLYDHQKLMANCCLTYHYQILAAEMGVGKTLSAIEVMEQSGHLDWWWAAPKSGLAAVEREFDKWGLTVQPRLLTYDRLRIEIERWEKGRPAPQGVVFDESQRLKTASAKRTKAAQHLADCIRAEYGWDGYAILMSGTPSPKSPVDWWAQCEVCYPGFLKEGNAKAFEWRLGIFQQQETDQGKFWKRIAWRDDERKCDNCGEVADHANHQTDDLFGGGDKAHEFVPSKNEVSYLYQRLEGLVLPLAKKDCLDIPDKIYRDVVLEPTSTMKRVAKALAKSAISVIQGLTWLRELSDGFQYREKQEGMETCPVCKGEKQCEQWFEVEREEDDGPVPDEVVEHDDAAKYELLMATCSKCVGTGEIPHMVRETKEIKTPKDQAVRSLLEENEDQGRLVFFAGFQGSVDRIVKICHSQQWNVVKVDGRGWKILRCDGEKPPRGLKPLNYWADLSNERVAFVAHPASGGVGLTLTESRMAVFYSNDFTPESRSQAEDRIHRPGIDENKGATIVDLFHLGTDRKVLNVLRDNRRLEQMTLNEFQEMTDDE